MQFRGGLETKGEFAINDKWVWGWEGVALSDYMLLSDYRLSVYKDAFQLIPGAADGSAVADLYLTGVGNRSYFDARTIYYESLSGSPVAGAGGLAGGRLFQRDQPPGPGRRGQLQDQLHQPDPLGCGVRSDHRGWPPPTVRASSIRPIRPKASPARTA